MREYHFKSLSRKSLAVITMGCMASENLAEKGENHGN